MKSLAIIGGGFSGLAALAALVERAQDPWAITLYEPSSTLGPGRAYSTQDPDHLLNVRAAGMGAYAGRNDDFFLWLQGQDAAYSPGDFLPRMLYARYLDHVLSSAVRQAQQKYHRIFIIHEPVRDIAPGQEGLAVLGAQEWKTYDAVIVACGNSQPRHPDLAPGVAEHKGWWPNPYKPGRWHDIGRAGHVVILGSGLSMIDALVTLHREKYDGDITAISPHARIPLPHPAVSTPFVWDRGDIATIRTLLDLIRLVKVKSASADWRDVLDGLRPYANEIWRAFPARERARARRHMSLWNICRHRIPAAMHDLAQVLEREGHLKRRAAAVRRIETMGSSLICRTSEGVFEGQIAINCMGYDYRIDAGGAGLLPALARSGVLFLEDGFPVPATASFRMNKGLPLYGIGPLWQGYLIESTAVREIREQASAIAAAVTKNI